MSKKVLIVEDNKFIQKYWARDLDGMVTVVSAFSLKEAEDKFADNPDISVMVIDACVSGNLPNSVPFVKKIRKIFSGPIIAASSNKEHQQELLRAGCDCAVEKNSVPQEILKVLGL